mgnify:CR=1 FL=1
MADNVPVSGLCDEAKLQRTVFLSVQDIARSPAFQRQERALAQEVVVRRHSSRSAGFSSGSSRGSTGRRARSGPARAHFLATNEIPIR